MKKWIQASNIFMALTLVLISSMATAAKGERTINCVLTPLLYIGNVYLKVSEKRNTYEISYDDPKGGLNKRVVSVSGEAFFDGKDSMGFEKIYMCVGQPCSGKTLLGNLKAIDQADGRLNDRVSYFSFNSNSNVDIKVVRFEQEFSLTGLSEFACSYK
jgi:hypothetical protein